jgi:hypothetical protein
METAGNDAEVQLDSEPFDDPLEGADNHEEEDSDDELL